MACARTDSPPDDHSGPLRNNSSSVRRALRVLDAVSVYRGQPGGISLTSLAISLEMSKSTVLRLIAPLRDAGMVHQDRDSGRYRLGPAVARLGAAFVDRVDLGVLAADLLRDLARRAGEPATLVLPDGCAAGERSVRTAGTTVLLAMGAVGDQVAGGRAGRAAVFLGERGWWAEIADAATGRSTLAAPVVDHDLRVVAAVEVTLPWVQRARPAGVDALQGGTPAMAGPVRDCAAALSGRLGAPTRSRPNAVEQWDTTDRISR